jgi:tripartite ATP-independent transporter DctM subunit
MTLVASTVLVLLFGFLALGVWVSVTMLALGVISLELFRTLPVPRILAQNLFNNATAAELLALPLFILMAEILFRTKISETLLRGFTPWSVWLPGRLLHVNVLASTVFAAVCGSSAATTATIGRITFGELTGKGYSRRAVMGSLAGAGTLGLLIPPSTVMIIYGILADVSILRLFIAGVIPGLIMAALFMVVIVVWAKLDPSIAPSDERRYTWPERLAATVDLLPSIALILGIIGSMYLGLATPTEAAAIGVVGALAVSAWYRSLTWPTTKDAFLGAVTTSSMIGLIAVAATFVSVAMGYLGIPRFVATQFTALGLSKYELILALVVLYLVLGCFLEGFSTIVLTLPVTLPLIKAAGFDPLWFGIFLTILIETAQITPPVGFNLFVIQGITGEKITAVAFAALPFLAVLVAMALLITAFPGIVSFLPNTMIGR